jgi:hypothetical protein
MKAWAALALLTVPAWGHVISMSSGDLSIQGAYAHYDLRLPLYEVAHVADPGHALLAHIRFSSAGRPAMSSNQACHADQAHGWYLCSADYAFAAPVDILDVECTFYAATVPSHVHLLRVDNGGKHDQGLFDISFPRATLRFRPPSALETAATEAGAGFVRAVGGLVQILFLAGLVLAARSRYELILLVVMFVTGQAAAATLVPFTHWQPPARFVEAAAALTIAYLAVEILLLPKAGMRWLILAVLGMFHGLYFELFLSTSGYHAVYVLAGAACAQVLGVAILAPVFAVVGKRFAILKRVPVLPYALLLIGMAWFFLRLRS